MHIAFTVPGEPQGKGRARVGKINGHARMFTPAKTVAYEGLIAHAAQEAMHGMPPFSGAVAVDVCITHVPPVSWSNKKRQDAFTGAKHPTIKPDVDNVLKAVGDGGNGVLWLDDKQIVKVSLSRQYGYTPGIWVSVASVEGLPLPQR